MSQEFTIEVPVIPSDENVWMIRTQTGKYYTDFVRNGYVALGWDKILLNELMSLGNKEDKIKYITKLYPDEKRPGLILSQIETFVDKIKIGDIILIPSKGGNAMSIGISNGIIDKVRREQNDEYEKCNYNMKLSVTWLKEIYTYQDVYLWKVLRAVQTISNITKHRTLVYRNLYNIFILDGKLHLMLKRDSNAPCYLNDRMNFDNSVKSIVDMADNIYKQEKTNLVYKTAISSPGFIEIISEISTSAMLTFGLIAATLRSKNNKDGITVTGISAIMKSISDLFNDKVQRDYTRAQTKKILIETESIAIDNEIKKNELTMNREKETKLSEETKKLNQAAKNMRITTSEVDKKS